MNKLRIEKLNNRLYFLIFLLTFTGYYAILLLTFRVGLAQDTREITIPLRLGVMILLLLSFVFSFKRLHSSAPLKLFSIFSLFYLIRLLIDYIKGVDYYMPISGVLLYFLSFAVVPFIVIVVQRISKKQLKVIFDAMVIGGAGFSLLSLFTYKQFIGEVGRLATGTVGEDVLSPLAMSYSGALTIGVLMFYLIFHKTPLLKKYILLIIIALSTIPFFLGASRGSLIALFVPFIIYFFTISSAKDFIKNLLITIVALLILIWLDQYLNSGLLHRFLGIDEAIEKGASSASRINIWTSSFNQFLNHPLIGDSIVVNNSSGYAHNIFLEILQTTGVVGFIPFGFLIFKSWKVTLNIFKHHKELIWVAIIFIQAFIQHLFSNSIYAGSWLWASMALIFSIDYAIKREAL